MAPEFALLVAVLLLCGVIVLLVFQLVKITQREQMQNDTMQERQHELVTLLAVKNDPTLAPLAHTQPSRQHQPQPDEPNVIFPEGG